MTTENITITDVAAAYSAVEKTVRRRIVICAGTGCVAGGAIKVFDALYDAVLDKGMSVAKRIEGQEADPNAVIDVHLSKSGCQGFCQQGPLVTIEPEGILYCKVRVEDVPDIVARQSRYAAEEIADEPLKDVDFKEVRGEDGLREVTLNIKGTELRLAVVHSLKNASKVAQQVVDGESPYHLIVSPLMNGRLRVELLQNQVMSLGMGRENRIFSMFSDCGR